MSYLSRRDLHGEIRRLDTEITQLRQESIGLKAKVVTSRAEITRLRELVAVKNEALEDIAMWAGANGEHAVRELAQAALEKE